MKGFARSLARGPKSRAPIVRQRLRVKNLVLSNVDGASGLGFGSVVIGDLPEGNILILGGTSYLQFQTADAGVIAAWLGRYGIGTTPASDATITGADVDLIASSEIAAATAKLSPVTRGFNATQAMVDNTDGSLEINLSLLIDDTSISANDVVFTVNGYVDLAYIVLGDD